MIQKKSFRLKQWAFYASFLFFVPTSCHKTTQVFNENGSGALSCVNQNCVAVGQYFQLNNSFGLPLAVFSNDNGRTFNRASQPTLPGDANPNLGAELLNVNCTQEHCAAVGAYNINVMPPTIFSAVPLVTFSHNSGKTFTSAVQPPLPQDANLTQLAGLRGITNSDQRLVGVGFYNFIPIPPTASLPLVVISDAQGKKFIRAYRPVLPSDISTPTNAELFGVSCVMKHCVAVGTYAATATPVQRPYVIISDDEGQSFNQLSQISVSDTTDSSNDMELKAITCNGLRCLAVGFYSARGITGKLPLVLMSNDGGVTFSMNPTPLLPIDANNALDAELKAINCSGLRCAAVGLYNFNSGTATGLALSVFSSDGGMTFSASSEPPLPTDAIATKTSELTGVSCLSTNCVGVGIYNANFTPENAFPLAVFSNKNAMEFITASRPALPPGVDLTQSNTLGDINP